MSTQDAQKALAMIERARKQGRASEVKLTRPGTPGVYNPATGKYEGGSPAQEFTGFGVKIGYEQSNVDGTLVQRGDQQLYVPALGFTRPATNEQITVASKTVMVVSVEVVAPGDTDILYIIQIRGA